MSLSNSDFPLSEYHKSSPSFSSSSSETEASLKSDEVKSGEFSALQTLEACDRQLGHPNLIPEERAYWLCFKAKMLSLEGQCLRAITCANEAIALQPEKPDGYACCAQAHEDLGIYTAARERYQQAIACLPPDPSNCLLAKSQAIWLRNRLGSVHRHQGNHQGAIASYNEALALDHHHGETLSHRAAILALTGKRKIALQDCKSAIQLDPNSVVAHNNLGIVHLINRQHEQALAAFDQALNLQPSFHKAHYNRAIALCMLGRDQEAIDSIPQALAISTHHHEPWVAHAWKLLGYCQLKKGRFADCITSCEQAQELQPNLYAAALYKLVSLIVSGRWLKRLSKPESRRGLWHDVAIVFNGIKFRLLAIALVLGLLLLGEGTVLTFLRSMIPMLFSIGIIVLIAADLWLHKSKIRFVWQTYFKSGMLIYGRAIAIIIATLTTFSLAEQIAPPFMMWGWANWVFGQPGNIIFQPFNLINQLHPGSAKNLLQAIGQRSDMLLALIHPTQILWKLPTGFVPVPAHATIPINFTTAFVLLFWVMLLLGIPFWARLEERIFRQGANSWREIGIRSTQFGLVHLVAGIPLIGGFVLIVPGFLFACRYKYVRDRHFKRHRNSLEADKAGMIASTADHAAYNAILVTLVVTTLLLTPG